MKPQARAVQLAQRFSRAAAQYQDRAWAQRQMALPLLASLPPSAAGVVDLGCGPGSLLPELANRYPQAQIVNLDLSWSMLMQGRRHSKASSAWLCANLQQLPLASASQELLVSNLALQWCQDWPAFLQQAARVLKPSGRLHFTTLLPASLAQWRWAWQLPESHFLPLMSLADYQQAAAATGWRMRQQQRIFRFHYPNFRALAQAINGVGAGLTSAQPLSLAAWRQAERRYQCLAEPQGLPLSYSWALLELQRP